jgi:hypothetical protein
MTQSTLTTSTPAAPADARLSLPKVGTRGGSGIAPLRGNGAATLQTVLFIGGAVMLPLGLVVIILGWYGASNTPYQYDQLSYLVSGGLFGLGLTFCGGFLYFGAWLARIAADQKESAKRLSETLLVLADVVSTSGAAGRHSSAPAAVRDPRSVLVVAAGGTTVHRADCALIAGRDDIAPAGPDGADLTPCRVCRPGS